MIPAQVETLREFKVLPYSPPEEITAFLDRVLEDCQVSYAVESYEDGFESSFDNSRLQELISQIQRSCTRFGFDGGVLPMLALGRTDGRFFAGGKAMVYGLSPLTMGDSFATPNRSCTTRLTKSASSTVRGLVALTIFLASSSAGSTLFAVSLANFFPAASAASF